MDDVQRKQSEIPKCFALSMLAKIDSGQLSKTEAAWATGTVLAGGSGTSPEMLGVFVLAMALYPEIMRRAQADIDALVGRDRMPNFGDWEHLSYIHAIVKRALRWKTVVPIGVPHRNTEIFCTIFRLPSSYYSPHFRTIGSTTIPNIWGMHLDPTEYPEPKSFNPDRFLDDSWRLKFFSSETHGQDIIRLALGNVEAPDSVVYDHGILLMPRMFNCTFTPRNGSVLNVVELENAKRAKG
ncbi:cytochrome P450 [Cytidiella melzeri]|nr:cytochrome P450 [Cytidiella melzeri]